MRLIEPGVPIGRKLQTFSRAGWKDWAEVIGRAQGCEPVRSWPTDEARGEPRERLLGLARREKITGPDDDDNRVELWIKPNHPREYS